MTDTAEAILEGFKNPSKAGLKETAKDRAYFKTLIPHKKKCVCKKCAKKKQPFASVKKGKKK